jgi:phosphatidylserine/phosphatidylglycerophosphate/cardiolipin synthase-like enzyme
VSDTARDTLVNVVTATTVASETVFANNSAGLTTTVEAGETAYLPLLVRNYTPPRYGVIIEAVLYDGQQYLDYDEAVLLLNGGDRSADLSGWTVCKWGAVDWQCADFPEVAILSRERLWFARSGVYFADSFGFHPDHVLSSWPRFTNSGDEVVLRDADGMVRDTLVYEKGLTEVDGWSGPAVWPYKGTNFAEPGQVLYRLLDEETGLPVEDTDTAADWAQHADDPWHGRRVRYPGWDLEQFYQPALGTRGTVTVGIAPDNAYQLVVDTIRSAEESIELEAYTLEHYQLVTELVQQAQQGVSVTVLLEGEPAGGIEDQELWACQQLHATGHGTCTFMFNADEFDIYDRYTLLHAKFIVVDRERLLLGSQNLTQTGLAGDDRGNGTGGSRGVVLVTDSPEMVARAVEVFQADCDPINHADVSTWAPDNAFGYGLPSPGFTPHPGGDWVTYTVQFPAPVMVPGTGFELMTAPEAALRGSDGLLGLVARASAGDAVYVEQLYEYREWGANPTDDPNLRLEAYIAAARRGARVRILLNGGDFGIEGFPLTRNIEAAAYVNEIGRAEGLDLSAHLGDPTQYGIHNKMVLIDLGAEGKYAHVGSINGSETSNKINREIALQVRSSALFNSLYAMFEYDWTHQPPQGHLLVSEVMYDPDGEDTGREWIELYNPTTEAVDLSGWYLGDVGLDGEYGSGLYRFPDGAVLVAEGVIVVAHQADDVAFTPDYEFLIDPHRDDPSVRNMSPAGSWDGFGLALGNTGDEVLLLNAGGTAIDVITYGAGDYPGVIPHPGVIDQGRSLERRPPREDTDDCSQDFFERYPPTPGVLPE